MVRAHAAKGPLARTSTLTADAKFKAEDDNVRRSFAFARAELNP
jgi:hypothetical protein